jgi:hypothetical protein
MTCHTVRLLVMLVKLRTAKLGIAQRADKMFGMEELCHGLGAFAKHRQVAFCTELCAVLAIPTITTEGHVLVIVVMAQAKLHFAVAAAEMLWMIAESCAFR